MEITNNDIIDGLHLAYEDDPAFEAQCLAYLANMKLGDFYRLSADCERALEEAGRCGNCGAVMEYQHGKEWHSETEDYEPYVEAYCPICDM